MEKRNWAAGSVGALVALVLAGVYAIRGEDKATSPASVGVVRAPVMVQRPVAAPTPVPRFPDTAATRQRPERKIVERIATHDRRGGDIKMMAAMMTTQPPAASPQPIEATMTAAGARLPVFAAGGDPPHVTCARTTCEVARTLPSGQTQAGMTTAFRDKDFERTLLARGYSPGPVMVADAGDGRAGFVFYINNEF